MSNFIISNPIIYPISPKIFRSPMWVAAIAGKLGEATDNGFVLNEPNIQVFEKKPKTPAADAAAAS